MLIISSRLLACNTSVFDIAFLPELKGDGAVRKGFALGPYTVTASNHTFHITNWASNC